MLNVREGLWGRLSVLVQKAAGRLWRYLNSPVQPLEWQTMKPLWQRVLLAAGGLLFAAMFVIGLWLTMRAAVSAGRGGVDSWVDVRSSLIVAAAALGAPFLVWRTWLAHRDTRIKQESHYTEIFSKAVEHLGDDKTVKRGSGKDAVEYTEPNVEVRMGAIFSLERLARVSEADYPSVIQTLSAYVVFNSRQEFDRGEFEPASRPDIRAAIIALARRNHEKDSVAGCRPILDGVSLQNSDLTGFNFGGVIMRNADLEEANLQRTNFSGAVLVGTDFRGARLHGTNFENAYLRGCKFTTEFDAVVLSGARAAAAIGLRQQDADDSIGNYATELPPDIDRPAHWTS